ncbi:MAG: hypothetical protein JOZ27_07040 [Caulobacteraceae bacterium]|nr:hypothetical protein [Caulobacteraceae bacterium]
MAALAAHLLAPVAALADDVPATPPMLYRGATLIDGTGVLAQGAEVLHAKAAGLMDDNHVLAEIGEVMSGAHPGRGSDEEVTLLQVPGRHRPGSRRRRPRRPRGAGARTGRARALLRVRPPPLRAPGVDEDEGDAGDLAGAVGPGVGGAALDEDVAGPHGRLAGLHDGDQLALKDDGVVDRVGRVHARVARVVGIVMRVPIEGRECRPHRRAMGLDIVRVRRNVDHPQHRSTLRRGQGRVIKDGVRRVDPAVGPRPPHVVAAKAGARLGAVHRRRAAILGDARPSVGVDAGDDAARGRQRVQGHLVVPFSLRCLPVGS